MMLPRGPRDRSGEEEQYGGLGGAFRDYRADTGRFDHHRERDRGGFGTGYEREREDFRRERDRERDEPSRADGDSNWGASKKPLPSMGGRGYEDDRRGARGYEDDRRRIDRDAPSRADEVDNWGSSKKMLPPAPMDRPGRYGESEGRHSRADETDNWASSKRMPAAASGRESLYRDSFGDADRWSRRDLPREEPPRRPRLVLAPPTRPPPYNDAEMNPQPPSSVGISDSLPPPRPKPKPNPFGSARPREEILAEKGQDWRRIDTEYEVKERDSRPSSSHSSRADTLEVSAEVAVKPKRKVNPFGDARPREVLLEEKGKDWRKMEFELEHRAVDRPETEEEIRLMEQIKTLVELSKEEDKVGPTKVNGVVSEEEVDGDGSRKLSLKEEIRIKETQLEQLIRTLDDKVRFSQRAGERPGSRSGRGERPGSRSGRADSRAFDSSDRPGSRSGHGEEPMERPWSRVGHVEGGRHLETLERAGSWTGHNESWRNTGFSERPVSRSGGSEYGRNPGSSESPGLHMQVGGVVEYAQYETGADIWTRSNEEVGYDTRES